MSIYLLSDFSAISVKKDLTRQVGTKLLLGTAVGTVLAANEVMRRKKEAKKAKSLKSKIGNAYLNSVDKTFGISKRLGG